jgi:hypothetical protein
MFFIASTSIIIAIGRICKNQFAIKKGCPNIFIPGKVTSIQIGAAELETDAPHQMDECP